MRYINLRFTYLLTNLRTGRTVERRTGKFAGERPTLYRCATQPTNQQAGIWRSYGQECSGTFFDYFGTAVSHTTVSLQGREFGGLYRKSVNNILVKNNRTLSNQCRTRYSLRPPRLRPCRVGKQTGSDTQYENISSPCSMSHRPL